MADIIDTEEIDRDTVDLNTLNQLFSKKYNLLSETSVTQKNSYVNKLVGSKSLKLAVGLSDNSIEVYELNKTSVSRICRLSGHKKGLTEVVISPKEDHLVYSSGLDGLVKLWDTRQSGTCVQEYKDGGDELTKPYTCMDVSCNGRILCAGSELVLDDAYLVFWDQRMPTSLGGYWNSHTEDITQVKFHKEKSEILATGSLDGLLNIFNVMEQTEDDALTYSLNVENSVEKISWLDGNQVACITQSNDLQMWDTHSGDMIKRHDRDTIARKMKRAKGDDCYVVDAYMSAEDTPVLLAGSHAGEGEVLRSLSIVGRKLQPLTNFVNNRQVVRCCWYNKHRDILVTGGEAGLMAVWGGGPLEHAGGAARRLPAAHRHRPY